MCYKLIKAPFTLCSMGITALELWSRKPYSTRLRLVLYGLLDHTFRAVIPVLHSNGALTITYRIQ